MGQYIAEIIIAVIAFAGTIIGTVLTNRAHMKLIEYRLEQLEKKVDLHNNVVERITILEAKVAVIEKKKGGNINAVI